MLRRGKDSDSFCPCKHSRKEFSRNAFCQPATAAVLSMNSPRLSLAALSAFALMFCLL